MSELRHDKHTDDYETRWAVLGPLGAVDFHMTNRPVIDHRSGGIEMHYRTPPDYMSDQAPSHEHCRLLDAPCWHDGSSLYASEVLIPYALTHTEDELWRLLEHEYRERFTPEVMGRG
jgi:hypothetical protein